MNEENKDKYELERMKLKIEMERVEATERVINKLIQNNRRQHFIEAVIFILAATLLVIYFLQ